MLTIIGRRLLYGIVLLMLMSVVSFVLIQLPPGDYVSSYAGYMAVRGITLSEAEMAGLRKQMGLDRPYYIQYLHWIWDFVRGDMGASFEYNFEPVASLLATRVPLTVALSLATLLFSYFIGIPIGIYSAVKQYTLGDYLFTILGFIGVAIPNFLLALVLMLFMLKTFGVSVGGLFSTQYMLAPWSFAKFVDLLKHLPVPIIAVGMASTTTIIRIVRASLLDELRKQYVVTARSKGLRETRLLMKYPVRVSLNPTVSRLAWLFPQIVSGTTITAIVLNLPTTGPLLYDALISQDMYLAGSIVMVLTILIIFGSVVSDILLAVLDPRIRLR